LTRADEGDAQDFLHSLRHGSQMGWLVDRMSEVVLVYHERLPDELAGDASCHALRE